MLAVENLPPGMIAVSTNFVGRYADFNMSFNKLHIPQGTTIQQEAGINVARQANNLIKDMPPEAEWIWFIDDDHVFKEDILIRLLAHNVEIVCPVVTFRASPFPPVIFGGPEVDWKCLGWGPIQGKSGLVSVYAHGKAGMLVRRRVFDLVPEPWFEMGRIEPDVGSMDLFFCHKAHQAGIDVLVDTDTWMGHITHMAVWPAKDPYGNFQPELRPPSLSNKRDQKIRNEPMASAPANPMFDWEGGIQRFFESYDDERHREVLSELATA